VVLRVVLLVVGLLTMMVRTTTTTTATATTPRGLTVVSHGTACCTSPWSITTWHRHPMA
jgi:hypothetical protein